MKIITLANQKGGIGKTTTATCLAAILNEWGHKTLLVDTDVQCNSTDTFRAATEDVATLYDLILDDDPCTLEEAIQHTEAGPGLPAHGVDAVADGPAVKVELPVLWTAPVIQRYTVGPAAVSYEGEDAALFVLQDLDACFLGQRLPGAGKRAKSRGGHFF